MRAIVGGRDVSSVGLNRALQARRQPGSAFKPFVYAAAMENGYSPASVIDGLNQPIDTYNGALAAGRRTFIGGVDDDAHGTAHVEQRAAVRVLEDVGIERAVSYAEGLGVGTVPSVPSLALGSGEVTLASMTSAYAAFAQGGIVREPYLHQAGGRSGRAHPVPERRKTEARHVRGRQRS